MTKKNVLTGAVLAMGIVMVFLAGYVWIGSWTYSEGDRTGIITKFSYKGFPIKTWEGELLQGGIGEGGGNVWEFSVSEPEIVKKVQKAQRTTDRWTLHYKQQLFVQSWKGKTSHFVVKVQKAE